jgi:hypothetical protein
MIDVGSFARHCEERSDEAIQCYFDALHPMLDCFAALAMTNKVQSKLIPL